MASCWNRGKPKHKHQSKALAMMHARKLNRITLWRNRPYVCSDCGHWHVGRQPLYEEVDRYLTAREERLVGKLIGALKQTINRVR